MDIKKTLIEFSLLIIIVIGCLWVYDNVIRKPDNSLIEANRKNDSLQQQINKRDVRIGVLEWRDSLLQKDYEDKINELKPIQNNFTNHVKEIKKYTSVQLDDEYNKGVAEQNSEEGVR